MPELPEVESVVRSLRSRMRGREISSWTLHFPPVLRYGGEGNLNRLKGTKMVSIRRRGKLIVMEFEGDMHLVAHLKMTGQFYFADSEIPPDKHTRFSLGLDGAGEELRFRDVRKFGFLACVDKTVLDSLKEYKDLGPEPLKLEGGDLIRRLKSRRRRLKPLLLDQTMIAGLGNIYVDEILFQSGLHPLRLASSLSPEEVERLSVSIKDVIRSAIRHRGSSIRDYRDALGMEGRFQRHHRVYGRESQPCLSCGRRIERLRISGRSSFFCPSCQPAP